MATRKVVVGGRVGDVVVGRDCWGRKKSRTSEVTLGLDGYKRWK
jgi:hypothetical protein